ncbi:MAG: hypothetical protein VYB08_12535 [Candidatus Latescibacterota bacterium]|nr:hypothetical protein [Candidatus Latescibacterota bacterium]
MRWNLLLVMLIPALVAAAPPTEGLNYPDLLARWRQLLGIAFQTGAGRAVSVRQIWAAGMGADSTVAGGCPPMARRRLW